MNKYQEALDKVIHDLNFMYSELGYINSYEQDFDDRLHTLQELIDKVNGIDVDGMYDAINYVSEIGECWGENEEWTYDVRKHYPKEFDLLDDIGETIAEIQGKDYGAYHK